MAEKIEGRGQEDEDARAAIHAMEAGRQDIIRHCRLPAKWRDEKGETLLLRAVRANCLAAVERMIAEGGVWNFRGSAWAQVWQHAESGGCDQAMESLFARSVGGAQGQGCSTPLIAAARHGLSKAAALLIPVSDLAERGAGGDDALSMACGFGRVEIAQALLDAGSPLGCDKDGQDALMAATVNGHVECVKLLVRAGAPMRVGSDGWSAMALAASYGYSSCCRELAPRSDLSLSVHGQSLETLALLGHGRRLDRFRGESDDPEEWPAAELAGWIRAQREAKALQDASAAPSPSPQRKMALRDGTSRKWKISTKTTRTRPTRRGR